MTKRPDNLDQFQSGYDSATSKDQLQWSHSNQTLFLAEISQKRKGGKALDIGCGTGTDSIFLAQQGWDVTSLDIVDKAVEMTELSAKEAGVSVTGVVADVLEWEAPHKYDLVLDHGLLHNMHPANHARYREKLFDAMSDDADFVIVHWLKDYPQQAVAMVGPNRASREEIKDFFAPEMNEKYFATEDKGDLSWVAGGAMSLSYYWFTLNNAVQKPAEFVSQIKSTLDKQGVDYEAMIQDAGDGLVEGKLMPHQMARMVGPGRWSLSHKPVKRDEGAMVLSSWAEKAGLDPHYIENLALVFGSNDHGKVCMDTPDCKICEVSFCRKN